MLVYSTHHMIYVKFQIDLTWLTGIALLVAALFLSASLGFMQESTNKNFARDWQGMCLQSRGDIYCRGFAY